MRHPDVHQAHVGAQRAGQLDRSASVGRLGDDLDVGVAVEDQSESGAHHLLVIRDQHSDHRPPPDVPGGTVSTGPVPTGKVACTNHPPDGAGPA